MRQGLRILHEISRNATILFYKTVIGICIPCRFGQLALFRAGLVYEPQERLMGKRLIRIFVSAVFLAFLFSTCITGIVAAAQVETLMGTVVKREKGS